MNHNRGSSMKCTAKEPQVCVILDTNVWLSSNLLRSELGKALLHSIHRAKGSLGLPEVVEMELVARGTDMVLGAAAKARSHISFLEGILGARINVTLPKRNKLKEAVKARIRWLGPMIQRFPLTLDQARRAIARLVAGTPLSGPNHEEFRDALIWEMALELARTTRVFLVTADRNFYEERDFEKGLSTCLREDINNSEAQIEVFAELGQCIARLGDEVPVPAINYRILVPEITKVIRKEVVTSAQARGFGLVAVQDSKVAHFPTDVPSMVAVAFSIKYELIDLNVSNEQERTNAHVVVKGECSYEPDTHHVERVGFEVMEFTWIDPDGEKRRARNHYASAHIGASAELSL